MVLVLGAVFGEFGDHPVIGGLELALVHDAFLKNGAGVEIAGSAAEIAEVLGERRAGGGPGRRNDGGQLKCVHATAGERGMFGIHPEVEMLEIADPGADVRNFVDGDRFTVHRTARKKAHQEKQRGRDKSLGEKGTGTKRGIERAPLKTYADDVGRTGRMGPLN